VKWIAENTGHCGVAAIARDGATIEEHVGTLNRMCSAFATRPTTVRDEFGHTKGFYRTDSSNDVIWPTRLLAFATGQSAPPNLQPWRSHFRGHSATPYPTTTRPRREPRAKCASVDFGTPGARLYAQAHVRWLLLDRADRPRGTRPGGGI